MTEEGTRLREVEGRRSSQEAGKAVYAEAARGVDVELAGSIEAERAWRKRYLGPVRRLVELGARSRDAALRIARDGLAAVDGRVELARDGGAQPLGEAIAARAESGFETEVVTGSGRDGRPELSVPFRGETLSGDRLLRQLERWVASGTIESSCRAAVEKVVANPDWLDLSDQRFVLLGAASEMCALPALCSWGADVIAVDLPRKQLWDRILATAREGRGRLHAPVRARGADVAEAAGADLLHDAPEIRTWLETFDGPLTVADDTYADGSRFLLVAATTDALMRDLAARQDVSLAYLATPTDVFAVPEEVVADARRRRRPRRAFRAISGGSLYRPNYEDLIEGEDGRRWGIVDCLVPQQGANYALAKNLQRWRAMVARDEGTLVSANVAPATRTRSVLKNRALSAAYRGAPAFGVEVFEPETSRWLMAALLVHDLRDGAGPDGHPFDLFVRGAAHGGIWRLGYEPRSVLPLAVVRGLAGRAR